MAMKIQVVVSKGHDLNYMTYAHNTFVHTPIQMFQALFVLNV
jgi:hypothetical protein